MHPLRFTPGLAAGVGLGAFVDGILFHQILQWHHFVSDDVSMTTLGGLETNTLWDGLFHAFSWAVCAAGIWLLWQAGRRGEMPARNVLAGAMLVGWGAFSMLDGVLLHLVAGIHHLYQRGDFEVGSDVLYLVASAAVVAIGLAVGGGSAAREEVAGQRREAVGRHHVR
jgi:uncharacterized membrane protein